MPASGSEAASTCEMVAGLRAHSFARTATNSA
jgi:hypothetical protein